MTLARESHLAADAGLRRNRDHSAYHLGLLGGFDLTCDGHSLRLPLGVQRVTAFLALHERPLPRTFVAGTLWMDRPEERAGGNLRSALWRADRLGVPLAYFRSGYLTLSPNVAIDVRMITARAQALFSSEWRSEVRGLDWILLYGELLPGWYEDWVLTERERIRQLRLHALEALCETLTKARRFGEAVSAGLAAVAADPTRESAHRVLIKSYLAERNVGEAQRQYEAYQRLIREELGVDPSEEMVRLLPTKQRSSTSAGEFRQRTG